MDTYLVITIDTEIDSPRSKPEFPYTLKNIKALPKLQRIFKKYNARPTYLITYPVSQNKESVGIFNEFLKTDEIEIGAHLHPWTNPPLGSEKERLEQTYPHNSELELKKLINLTKAIEKSFSKKPLSYRAGRYGFDEESLNHIEQLGFLVDTSITPTVNWSFDGGPNFASFDTNNPYFLDRKDIRKEGLSPVLEVPISIIINKSLPRSLEKIYCNLPLELKSVFKKAGLIKTIWLRPSVSSFLDMKFISNLLLERQSPVLNMMFHSNEIMPGTSPYIKTEMELDRFFFDLEAILDYLLYQKKVKSKTLSELYNIFSS
jgi:hypothetical protein